MIVVRINVEQLGSHYLISEWMAYEEKSHITRSSGECEVDTQCKTIWISYSVILLFLSRVMLGFLSNLNTHINYTQKFSQPRREASRILIT